MENLSRDPQFITKKGEPTEYAFACGHVLRLESVKTNKWKEMYMEHSHYHIRSGNQGEKWKIWEVFSSDELTKARKFFSSINVRK